jgi:hypothetical protein
MGAFRRYNNYMLKFYKDFNSRVAAVYQREPKLVLVMQLKADGIKCFAMSASEFARKWTHPMDVDTRKAVRTWYCRALTKTGNDPRAFQLLGEFLMIKPLNEMTMEELVEHHNQIATELSKPTVDTFKSLRAARAAVKKLTKPVAQKAVKEPVDPEKLGRGPVQGIGAFAKALLLEGGSNKDVHAAVMAQFPSAKTTVACIAYYRSKLVLAGQLTSSRATKVEATPEEAAA